MLIYILNNVQYLYVKYKYSLKFLSYITYKKLSNYLFNI